MTLPEIRALATRLREREKRENFLIAYLACAIYRAFGGAKDLTAKQILADIYGGLEELEEEQSEPKSKPLFLRDNPRAVASISKAFDKAYKREQKQKAKRPKN